jgi:hypothetical protein
LVFAGVVLVNRFLLIPLMPFEVEQHELFGLFDEARARSPGATYLVPWLADYAVLRSAYPDARIELCLSQTP